MDKKLFLQIERFVLRHKSQNREMTKAKKRFWSKYWLRPNTWEDVFEDERQTGLI